MTTCASCRHKGPAVVQQDFGAGGGASIFAATPYSVCLALRPLGTVRVGAGDITVQGPAEGFQAGHPAGLADRSGHGASLCVTDDFGCNRWQPA